MNSIRIRASSWSDLFDCAMRWESRNLNKIRQPTSGAAHLGTSVHASTAAFDQARLNNAPISIDDAAGVFVDTLHNPETEVAYTANDIPRHEAEKIGLRLHTRYCAEIAPKRDYVAVELDCAPLEIDCKDDIIIQLTGTTDRVRRLPDGQLGISDLKTGARRTGNAKTDLAQLGVYTLLAERQLGQDITGDAEIIGLSTKTGAIGTVDVPQARDTIIDLIPMAAMMLRSGIFPPNPSSISCGKKWCPIYSLCRYKND